MELGEPDESGRRRPVVKENSKFKLECDLAVIAVGAGANPLLSQTTPDLKLNQWGYIEADPVTGKTQRKGSGLVVISLPVRPRLSWPWERAELPPTPYTTISRGDGK